MDIGFIFTNYNNTQYTEAAIKSIYASDACGCAIIIVDNASEDAYAMKLEKLCKRFDQVTLIHNEENLGYFSGLNIGIHRGREKYPEIKYWVIGNNDLTFPVDFKSKVFKADSVLNRYPVVSPNIVTIDGVHQNPHVISKISKFREFIYDLYHLNYYLAGAIKKMAQLTKGLTDRDDESQHEIAQEIYQGYGACYILTPVFFQHFRELWSPTFLMYEEFFLSKQLEDEGFKTYYEPSIMVQHHWHATTNQLPGKVYWEFSKNAHKEYRKYIKVSR